MYKAGLLFLVLLFQGGIIYSQTFTQEAMNNFALYSKSGEFSQLEKARKAIDDGYKTKKDSLASRNNLIRSMVYSTLAFVDSSRKLSYKKDPIEEAVLSSDRLNDKKFNDEHSPEINFVHKQLANAFIIRANKLLKKSDLKGAFSSYRLADSLSSGDILIKHNMALLSERLGYTAQAISYYEQLIETKKRLPEYYMNLSGLYQLSGNNNQSLKVLEKGHSAFPKNKDLLFAQLNLFCDSKMYSSVNNLVDEAISLDPTNKAIYYMAAFSYEMTGNLALAEKYYKKLITLDPGNYNGNYSLGLLYLSSYIGAESNKEKLLSNATQYLTKASEINPNSKIVLKSLAILYKKSGDTTQLDSINNKINTLN
jgi:tetratricopeptide (TPR) repeat protein